MITVVSQSGNSYTRVVSFFKLRKGGDKEQSEIKERCQERENQQRQHEMERQRKDKIQQCEVERKSYPRRNRKPVER